LPALFTHYLALTRPWLDQYGVVAVFAGILLEDFGLPTPGEALLIGGALLASRGEMPIWLLLPSAWLAAVLGDNIGYALGRFGGRRLVLRFGAAVRVREAHLARVERFFARYGKAVVVAARFFALLRQLNGIVAGLGAMAWWPFLAYNGLGAALWVGVWGLGVFLLGQHVGGVLALFKDEEPYIVIAVLLILAAGTWYAWRRPQAGASDSGEPDL
jgi:membrane protein DedA with SNARE-associated domain